MRKELIEKSRDFVRSQFENGDTELLTYHNFQHTQNVYEAAKGIAENDSSISDSKLEALVIAALFHDVGFVNGAEEHEERGAKMAASFLKDENCSEDEIALIQRLIRATKMNHEPSDELEQIIRDADLSHLGKKEYLDTTFQKLYQEINNCSEADQSLSDWVHACIEFLSKHRYNTKFAQEKYGSVKEENIQKLKAMEQKLNLPNEEAPKKKKKKKSNRADSPLKGVETMFKVSLRNHVNLSQIADNKANTLISVNAIIISIVLSALFPKLDSNPFLFYPGISILLFTIVTIIISILSTIPNVNRGIISKKEVQEKKGNLLFFGNFFKMNLEEYEWSMNELMNDKDYLYNSMTRDLYFLGKVLNKKYTLLRYAYYSFVIGLLASILIFVFSISQIIEVW